MSKGKLIARWSVIPLSVLLLLGMALAGCGSKSSSISDILKKSEDASKTIVSMHQETQLNYTTDSGSGTMQSQVIDVSGGNIKAQDVEFGTTVLEKVLFNGRQWSKTFPNTVWVEDQNVTNPATSTSGDISKYDTLPTNSKSQKELPKEAVAGYTCYHFQFELTQENVKAIFTQVSQESLANNNGGTVDLWIDENNYYLIKLQGNFDNVNIAANVASLNNVNLQIILLYTQINQPITINPPI